MNRKARIQIISRLSLITSLLFCFFLSEAANILTIPADVKELQEEEFRDREDIVEVVFEKGSSVSVIPTGTFRGCTNLRKVTLPDALQSLGAHAFAYCSDLEEISFPSSLKRIGNNAFSRCSSLKKIYIPDSVSELESYAFSDCESLLEARLPANNSLLGELIFSGCTALTCLREPSPLPPPFDCASFIFEPDDNEAYRRCRLILPDYAIESYRNAPGWRLFF